MISWRYNAATGVWTLYAWGHGQVVGMDRVTLAYVAREDTQFERWARERNGDEGVSLGTWTARAVERDADGGRVPGEVLGSANTSAEARRLGRERIEAVMRARNFSDEMSYAEVGQRRPRQERREA